MIEARELANLFLETRPETASQHLSLFFPKIAVINKKYIWNLRVPIDRERPKATAPVCFDTSIQLVVWGSKTLSQRFETRFPSLDTLTIASSLFYSRVNQPK